MIFQYRTINGWENTSIRIADYRGVMPLFVFGTEKDMIKAGYIQNSGNNGKRWAVVPFDQVVAEDIYSVYICDSKLDAIEYIIDALNTARFA